MPMAHQRSTPTVSRVLTLKTRGSACRGIAIVGFATKEATAAAMEYNETDYEVRRGGGPQFS